MLDAKLSLLWMLAENYLRNPFFAIPLSTRPVHPLLHQTEVVARALLLYPTRILIADVIGLGKTVEALRVLYALGRLGTLRRVLVVVPTVLEKQWEEEARRFGFEPRRLDAETLRELAESGGEGFFIGRMDTLKKNEYFHLLERVEWDAIVVDEAHRLEMPGTLRSRYVALARSRPSSTVILLSATPHRGKERLYLYLLSALDPATARLIPRKRGRGAKPIVDAEYYVATHNVLVYRRTKDDVNRVYEQREVFKPAKMLTVLLRPSDAETRLLDSLLGIANTVVKRYHEFLVEAGLGEDSRLRGVAGLLSVLLVKRGMSSPKAIVETFTRVVSRRAGEVLASSPEEVAKLVRAVRATIDPEEFGEEPEAEPDEVFNRFAEMLLSADLLPSKARDELVGSLELARRFVAGEIEDSKIEFLARLVDLACGTPAGDFSDMKGAKIVVFTEFRDTAHYVYSRLLEALRRKYANALDMVRVLTSENKGEYKEVVEWLEKPGVKVLVATDVMSEGLNLQQANVVVNYEVVYSPVKYEQRVGRVWRYGQQRTVYVFNLFYLHPQEKRIHDIFFRKVYTITESLGKQEVSLGNEVYLVTVYNTVFDETLKKMLGAERAWEVARNIGAVPLTKVVRKARGRGHREKETYDEVVLASSLLMPTNEYERYLARLAEELVSEIVSLAKAIEKTKVYPGQASRSDVENSLRVAWGIGNYSEAERLASTLYGAYQAITRDPFAPRDFIEKLYVLASRCSQAGQPRLPMFFAVGDPSRRVYMLYRVSALVGKRVISDFVAVEVDLDANSAVARRGCDLADSVARLLHRSVHVDEVYGWLRETIATLDRVCSIKAVGSVGFANVVSRVKQYEETKKGFLEKAGAKCEPVFATQVRTHSAELVAVFFTTGLLPRAGYVPATGVWGEFERLAVDIVAKFEEAAGRVPKPVHLKEHYDIYSKGPDGEVRYIECKSFVDPTLEFQLTEAEYSTARELGDAYWLYLVYGVGTDRPVVLAIRNPVHRLRLVTEVYEVRVVRYRFSPGSQ